MTKAVQTKGVIILIALFTLFGQTQAKAQIWAAALGYAMNPGWASAGAAIWTIRNDYEASTLSEGINDFTANVSTSYRGKTSSYKQHYWVGADNNGHFQTTWVNTDGTTGSSTDAFDFAPGKSSYSCYTYDPSYISMGQTVNINSSFYVLHTVNKWPTQGYNQSPASGSCSMIFTYDVTPSSCGQYNLPTGKTATVGTGYRKNSKQGGISCPNDTCMVTSFQALKNVPY